MTIREDDNLLNNAQSYVLLLKQIVNYLSPLRQVSHHPPAAAHHVISDRGWTLRQEITVASKFRGKYLSIMPLGKRSAQSILTQ